MFLLDSSHWTIRQTGNRGRGVFAQKDIAPGTVIGDYLGKIYPDEEAEKLEGDVGLYSMSYGKNTSIFPLNVNAAGIHLINHSCMPNCSQYCYQNRTLYVALRRIFPGEELTTSYDMEYSDVQSPGSYACFCGTLLCRATMCVSAQTTKTLDALVEEKQHEWIDEARDIHTILEPLSHYPHSVPDDPIYDIFVCLDKPPHTLQDAKMPDVKTIRSYLRGQGVPIGFASIGIEIIGIYNGILLVRPPCL